MAESLLGDGEGSIWQKLFDVVYKEIDFYNTIIIHVSLLLILWKF